MPDNFDTINDPNGLSKIVVLTSTVNTTPKISIITCIDVELWAGSIRIFFNNIGNTAPKQILVNTINANADVTAIVSANGVLNAMARMKPAMDNTALNDNAILNSRLRNWPWVFSFNVPSAIPRITIVVEEDKEKEEEEKLEKLEKRTKMINAKI